MNKNLEIYKKYYIDKKSENLELFELLKAHFGLTSAIYPGSFVHITPSFVFQKTAYIDNDRRIAGFFSDPEVLNWVESKKEYIGKPIITAFQQNYSKKVPADLGQYELLISQYAGFVSQECKHYLKSGGLLLVNNSHADAGLAFLDSDYELVAAVNYSNGKSTLKTANLNEYFVPKKNPHPTKSELLKTMLGVGYKKTATSYIFRKR